jgi:hypothetical protein
MLIPLVLLATLATTPIMITEDAFARYQRHTGGGIGHAASITNSCLSPVSNSNTNGNMISNGNCGGTVSQQGKSGQASTPTTVQNANPTIEVQRSTSTAQPPLTTTRGNCTACFDPLTPAQITAFEGRLKFNSLAVFGTNITTVEQLCTFLESIAAQGGNPSSAIDIVGSLLGGVQGVSFATISNITTCLERTV